MYSPIDKIVIKNYQGIGEFVVQFEEGKKILLSGYNSACKTAFKRFLEIIGHNAYSKEQVEHIRHGQACFEGGVYFQDGSWVYCTRDKEHIRFQAKMPDGTMRDTLLPDGSYMALEGNTVPYWVSQLLGFKMESSTKQKLNLRAEEDGLLFVTTTGGVNYKTVYDTMGSEQVMKAIAAVNEDINTDRAELTKAEGVRGYLMMQESPVYDLSEFKPIVVGMEAGLEKTMSLSRIAQLRTGIVDINSRVVEYIPKIDNAQFELISEIKNHIQEIFEKKSKVHDRVDKLDESLISRWVTLKNSLELRTEINRKKPQIHDLIKNVPLERFSLVNQLRELKTKLDETEARLTENIQTVDLNVLNGLRDLMELKNSIHEKQQQLTSEKVISIIDASRVDTLVLIQEMARKIKTMKTSLEASEDKLVNLRVVLKEKGLKFCPNCSTIYVEEQA